MKPEAKPVALPQPARSSDVPPEASLGVVALLTFAGGFLDAFTYVGHGQVFANAMTANVVFLGMFAATGLWEQAIAHGPPVLAFLVGVFLTNAMRLYASHAASWRAAHLILVVEILCLGTIAFLPRWFPDLPIVLSIALVAAMQNSSFTLAHSWTYNSVVTTTNLRRLAEGLFAATVPRYDPAAARQAGVFAMVCFCFLAGAAAGAFSTARLHNAALGIAVAVLAAALLRFRYLARRRPVSLPLG